MDDAFVRSAAFVAAVLPPIIIVTYFLVGARVRFDAEMVWAGFGFGACAAFPAIVFAKLLETTVGYGDGFLEVTANEAFFGAAIPEEMCKFAALLALCSRQIRDLQPNHLFALSTALAGGFACFENIFYVVENENWHATAVLRSVSAVPGHAFVGAVMGLCIVRAVRGSFGGFWWGAALFLPIALHAAYDFFIMALTNLEAPLADAPHNLAQLFVFLFVLTVIIEGVLAHVSLRAIHNMRGTGEEHLQDPGATPPLVRWLQAIGEHPIWWATLGGLCLLVAGRLFSGGPIGTEQGSSLSVEIELSLGQGFSAFAALHGAAFIGLSIVVRRRVRSRSSARTV